MHFVSPGRLPRLRWLKTPAEKNGLDVKQLVQQWENTTHRKRAPTVVSEGDDPDRYVFLTGPESSQWFSISSHPHHNKEELRMEQRNELLRYLNNNHVEYQVHTHVPAFSAHNVAMASHVADGEMAKTLVVQAGKQKWLVVLRADYRIDQRLLRHALETHSIHLVSEEELETLFPNCEVGAIPPFGNLYGLPVIVDKSLAEDAEFIFNACTHSESIRMKYEDFERFVKPVVLGFAVPENTHASQLQGQG